VPFNNSLAAKPKTPKDPPRLLPVPRLEDLNLADELYAQYVSAKQMLEDSDEDPLNQKAQTTNSIVNILAHIAKIRTDLYNAERLKKLESCLLTTLKEFPEISERFIELYEEELLK
jgi:hypothetical protein